MDGHELDIELALNHTSLAESSPEGDDLLWFLAISVLLFEAVQIFIFLLGHMTSSLQAQEAACNSQQGHHEKRYDKKPDLQSSSSKKPDPQANEKPCKFQEAHHAGTPTCKKDSQSSLSRSPDSQASHKKSEPRKTGCSDGLAASGFSACSQHSCNAARGTFPASPALKRGFLVSNQSKSNKLPVCSRAGLDASATPPDTTMASVTTSCNEQSVESAQQVIAQGLAELGSLTSVETKTTVGDNITEKSGQPDNQTIAPNMVPWRLLEILQENPVNPEMGPWRIETDNIGRVTLKRSPRSGGRSKDEKEEDTRANDSVAAEHDEATTNTETAGMNTRGRYSYSTGGEGQNAWLRIQLPPLDKKSRTRLRSPASGGAADNSSEREVLEMYSKLVKKTKQSGITVPDIAGTEAFTEKINLVRQKIEKEYKEAQDRFTLAKRVASINDDLEKNVRLLVPAEEALQAASKAVESYKVVQKLWALSSQRIRDAIDETQALKGFNEIEQIEMPPSQNTSDRPKLGLFQPYHRDTLPPRFSKVTDKDACSASWDSERLYDEARAACLRGQFCTGTGFALLRELDREKEQIENGYPSRQRINRAKAYKKVCNLVTTSGVNSDCEVHRQFMIKYRVVFRGPIETEVPGSIERFVEIFPELASSLGVGSSDGGADPIHGSGGSQHPEPLARAASRMGMEDVTVQPQVRPLSIEIPCFQRPSAFGAADNDLAGTCVSCLERPALFVARSCGHLTYCRTCQRKAIAQQLEAAGQGNAAGRTTAVRRRAHTLSNKELNRTRVTCPMCRHETSLVAREVYNGKVFEL